MIAGAALCAAPAHAVPAGDPAGTHDRIAAFFRALPVTGLHDPAASAGLCSLLPEGGHMIERILIDRLEDPASSDTLRMKSVFGLGCLVASGRAGCSGSFVAALVVLDQDPGLSAGLRLAVSDWLGRMAGEDPVPRTPQRGPFFRRDYARWWAAQGRFRHRETCSASRI